MIRWKRAGCVAFALVVAAGRLSPPVRAQAAGVPVFDDEAILASITRQASQLKDAGRLVPVSTLAAQRDARPKCRLRLPAVSLEKLTPAQVCAVAHRSTWIVGTLFHCLDCQEWHFSGATGYAIAADGAIATCAHVVESDPDSTDEFLAAADPDGVVHPVLEVLAADLRTDTCIVRVDAKDLVALALQPDSHPGDAVYCYGHPQHHFGFFAQGEIARFAVEPPEDSDEIDDPKSGAKGGDAKNGKAGAKAPAPAGRDGPPVVVMEITAEFAAGSSGSPVLDQFGNVVGHAAATEAVFWDEDDPSATNHQMTLRIVTVARDVLSLIEPLPAAPAPAPAAKKAPDGH